MPLMLDSAVAMEKEDMTTGRVEVEEGMKIQPTVIRLVLQQPRRTARRNNHARCARLLDRVLQILDVLRRVMMTGADILGNAPRDQVGLGLVSTTAGAVFVSTLCPN